MPDEEEYNLLWENVLYYHQRSLLCVIDGRKWKEMYISGHYRYEDINISYNHVYLRFKTFYLCSGNLLRWMC